MLDSSGHFKGKAADFLRDKLNLTLEADVCSVLQRWPVSDATPAGCVCACVCSAWWT